MAGCVADRGSLDALDGGRGPGYHGLGPGQGLLSALAPNSQIRAEYVRQRIGLGRPVIGDLLALVGRRVPVIGVQIALTPPSAGTLPGRIAGGAHLSSIGSCPQAGSITLPIRRL